MSLATKSRIGAYEIAELIGAGGMGEVYRASDPRLKRDVAVKVLPAVFAKDADRMRRFELEAQAAGRLNHPNVLAIYDIGVHDGSPYLVSELLEGGSLRTRLREGKLSPQRALEYSRQIAAGLAAAHAAGIVHRDLKPENLFITRDRRVKILDFGLAKLAPTAAEKPGETQTVQTSAGTILGTVAYMAPEQIRGQSADHRSDIFAFGCVLHEMLTGQQPFKGQSAADTMSATLTQERPELNIAGGLAPALDRIVGHCLEKQPEDRFQSAQDLAFDLASISGVSQVAAVPPPRYRNWRRAAVGALAVALFTACGFVLGRVSFPTRELQLQRLTFRRGVVDAARFAPDGRTIVYSAMWENDPGEVFAVRTESPESRSLGFPGAVLLGISRSGELALGLRQRFGRSPGTTQGLLARAPFSGGAPRAIDDRITAADWSADGSQMALVRDTDAATQLEYPAGTVLYRTAGSIMNPRISPSGDRVAFVHRPITLDTAGEIAVVDRSGRRSVLTPNFASAEGVAWSPKGDEIWFTAAPAGGRHDLWAVTLGGKRRLVHRQTSGMVLGDISAAGQVLLASVEWRQKMVFRGPGDDRERELSWLDWSLPTSLSRDGKLILFSESGEGASGGMMTFMRETNGSPAVKLGPGAITNLSRDGQFAVTVDPNDTAIMLYPIGAGPTRRLPFKGFTIVYAGMFPDGKRLFFDGHEPSRGRRIYVTDIEGSAPLPITPEGTECMAPMLTPDGKYFFVLQGGRSLLLPVAGGTAEPLGIAPDERVTGWAEDGSTYFVYRRGDSPTRVYRVDRKTGRRDFFAEIGPSDRAGIGRGGTNLELTPDGRSYVYSVIQSLSELHLLTGLR